jgi:Glycosyl hydrolases family 16
MLPTAPAKPRRGRRGGSGPHRTWARLVSRRTVLFAGITLAAAIVAVGIFDLIPRQVSGHTVGDGQISHSATPTADAQPVFVGHPAVAGAPVPDPTQSGKKKHPGAGPLMPAGVPGNWKLVFDDEFNGASLDTSKWSTGWLSSGITGPVNHKESECYDPSQVAVGGGSVNLTLIAKSESCGINDPEYATGLINTAGKFTYTYGLLEARVWLPAANGAPNKVANWPAVWTDGQNWPYDGEDDVAEGLTGQVCAHFHSAAETSGVGPGGGSGCLGGAYAEGWHTFAANWQPGSVTYYYDGVDIGSVTRGVTSAPMFIVLSYDAGNAYPKAPATMKVDYVRVWQHP